MNVNYVIDMDSEFVFKSIKIPAS